MLEKIREGSQGIVAKTILVLVIFSFAFAGVSSYLGSSTGVPAAIVNGVEIPETELEQAFQNERASLKQQYGEMFDALSADDSYMQGIRKGVLDRLVANTLVNQAAVDLGLRVSDEQIKQAIFTEPAFQTDGQFDNDRYQAVLRQLNYQPITFRNSMRVDMTRSQLLKALIGSEFVLDGEAKQLAEVQSQTRDIRYIAVDSTPFLASADVTAEEAKTFYDANLMQFMSPELVSLEYVELNVKDMINDIIVDDAEATEYYQDNQSQYQTPEKRLASHIYAASGDDAADKAKLDAIAARIAAGEDFAELAKTESDDKFSAEQGGQIDWFEQGVMDTAFDEVLFSLEKGQVSEVVKGEFGFHIIKLVDVQPGAIAAFDDVKAKIVAQIKETKALSIFYGLQTKLADTSYEIPDTLIDTANAVNKEVQTTALFTRDNPPANLNKPDLVKAAFSEQVLSSGLNSEVIELDPNHVVVIRVKQHQDAGTMSFDKVEAQIVQRLKNDKANEAAREKAATYMTQLKAGDFAISGAKLVTVAKLDRFNQDIDAAIANKAFKMPVPEADTVSIDTVALGAGYAVVVLDKVNAAENIEASLLESMKESLSRQYGQADYRAVIDTLKSKAQIEYPVAE
ncbi:SurA N-terminal domain-containing protein [Shewanella sp. OMA3-2]|uniref:SurA N-terminal domain-containing protein n=1 Tax=Shewanella sp. OMA3-2 TaxID=2908650 RepID=UPI001F16DC5F|nr:SurA N-terminal domain-containing protein [Shewanella sp. OMA3-2]UJF23284.1 SurA N-terminal domain-containing protein [Shewanella sp. OMA3-2]